MDDLEAEDAATFARRHAGELDRTLTPQQRERLGRALARGLGRAARLEQIAQAAARALPELRPERALRLGRDEALRALAADRLGALRRQGEAHVILSPAADACRACRDEAGLYPIGDVPRIPVAGCTHPAGCRCMYRSRAEVADAHSQVTRPASAERSPDEPVRPWYRSRPPRPHPPRWTDEQRAARGRPPRGRGARADGESPRRDRPRRRDDSR